MYARRRLKRRIDDALATASPLALVEATDSHICNRSSEDVRALIERSLKRMDDGDRAQLALYLNLDDPDDLIAHRFSAFLRQNPRAMASLDPDAIEAILAEVGDVPEVQHPVRRLPARTVGLALLAIAVALLPLAAQYAHQRGLLAGLSEPVAAPPVVVPFVETIRSHRAQARTPVQRPVQTIAYHPSRHVAIVPHRTRKHTHRAVAVVPRAHRSTQLAWKFDPRNNPYMNRVRWRHPYVADATPFGMRARLHVRSYLNALVAGNLSAALIHLGMPANGDTNALAELPIITRDTAVAIVGSKPQADGSEQVQADITTDGREYFAVFAVAHDGPAARITAHYYIPVNRRAQIASRVIRTL